MTQIPNMIHMVCYETASSFPFHIFAYVPFWNHLRFSKKATMWILFAIQIFFTAIYMALYCAGYSITNARLIASPIFGILFFYLVQMKAGKIAFLYIFTTDYLMIIKGAAYYLGTSLLHTSPFSIHSGLIVVFLFFITMPMMLRYINSTAEMVFSIDSDIWKSIWLLPLLNSLIVLLFTYPVENGSVRMLIARTLLMLCMFLIYHLLVRSIKQTQEQSVAEERSRSMELLVKVQTEQYAIMQSRIAETKRARHDLRHHWKALKSYVDHNDLNALSDYITKYVDSLPKESCIYYCMNPAINALLCFYAEKALQENIDIQIAFPVKDQTIIPEPELCVLLGNLLENALEACISVKGERFIRVNGIIHEDRSMVLTIDNTGTEPETDGDIFYSSKRKGAGIGTESVRMIANRYHGNARFEWRDGVFYASVMLYSNRC